MLSSNRSDPAPPASSWIPTRGTAVKIALTYCGVGTLWIFGSGWLLHHLVHDAALAALFENLKGWAFVMVTAFLLGTALNQYFFQIRRAANQLQEDDARLRLIGDNLPGSYVYQYAVGPDGQPCFSHISAGVERVHGLKPAEVLRDAGCLFQMLDPAQMAAYSAAEAESARSLSNFEMNLRVRRPEGGERIIHLQSRPSRDEAGRVRWNGLATDISERERAAAAVRERESQFATLFHDSPAAIGISRLLDGRFIDVNKAFAQLHGYSREEIIGRSSRELRLWHSGDREQLVAELSERKQVVRDMQARRKSGEIRSLLVSVQSIELKGEACMVGTLIDVTERKRAEAALRQSELKFALAFANNPAAIALTRLEDGVVLEVNDTWTTLCGYSREEILGRSARAIWPSAEAAAQFVSDLRGAGAVRREQAFRHKSGAAFLAELSAQQLRFESEDLVLSTLVDITARRRAEDALRQSEEQFRAIFDTASIGMAQTDPHSGRFVRVNRKMCEITGYSQAELTQMTFSDITHADDRDHDRELFQKVVRGELPDYQIEKRYVRRNGKLAWVKINMSIVRDAAGRPAATMAAIQDISERRKTDEERLRLSTALEQAAESIIITDLSAMILYVNPAFERITGYSRREAIGQNPGFLKSGRHDTAFYRQMWDTLLAGEVWRGRIINKRRDGTLLEEDASISPVRDASGKIVNFMAIKLDISREVELEGQVRQAQKLEAIGQLAGGVAHDFNNLLTSINMQIELINMESEIVPAVRDGLAQIQSDADRAASLTRQLLLFSRRQVMQSRDVDLNEIVTHLAKMLQRIIGEDVRLQLHLHSAPLAIHADPGMLDQVAMNLAVNARDAMPEGGRLLIETSEKVVGGDFAGQNPDAAPGRYVCLAVSDTGCGIPPEVLPRIFEPFFTTKEAGKGTGLGLATVFGIVKQHRGWLAVETKPGCGTTFRVHLPAIAAADLPAAADAPPKARGGTEGILLAEDDVSVRRMAVAILTRHGYRVFEAASGAEALALWRKTKGDVSLLVTDLVMPGGTNGQRLAGQLRAEKPGLKVVFASGYSAEIAGREIQLRPGENFLQKPFHPELLLATIRAALDNSGGS